MSPASRGAFDRVETFVFGGKKSKCH
jgi:hypothetical protein